VFQYAAPTIKQNQLIFIITGLPSFLRRSLTGACDRELLRPEIKKQNFNFKVEPPASS
jgi:hypothetical protein